MRVVPAFLAVGLVFAMDGQAIAQTSSGPPPGTTKGRALERFERSEARYREGRFAAAVELLLEAYRIHPEPVLLYNLGRAYEGLGDLDRAIDAYARYLGRDPSAPDLRSIETRIATLRNQIDDRQALRQQRDEAKRRAEEVERAQSAAAPRRTGPSALPWIVGGAGVLSLGGGGVLWLRARTLHEDAVADPVQQGAQAKQAQGERSLTAANIALVAGGVLTAGGALWLALDRWSVSRNAQKGREARVSVWVAPGGVLLQGRF